MRRPVTQLGQLPLEGPELADPGADLSVSPVDELGDDAARGLAGIADVEHLAHLGEGQPDCLGRADEGEAVHRVPAGALRPALGCVMLASGLGVLTKVGVDVPPSVIVGLPLLVGLGAYALHRSRREPIATA